MRTENYFRNYYHKRKDKGVCVQCGAELPKLWGHVLCSHCRAYRQSPTNINEAQKKTIAEKALTLDEMAKEAKKRGISYGRLQQEETIIRLKERERVNITLQRWGR